MLITISPIPLWYRLDDESRKALALYQMETYGLELGFHQIIHTADLDTEQADREMRQPPRHQPRVK